MSLGED